MIPKSERRFQVDLGHSRFTGRKKMRYFRTEAEARAFVSAYFERDRWRTVLSIEAYPTAASIPSPAPSIA